LSAIPRIASGAPIGISAMYDFETVMEKDDAEATSSNREEETVTFIRIKMIYLTECSAPYFKEEEEGFSFRHP
jgi:hypothetical protein